MDADPAEDLPVTDPRPTASRREFLRTAVTAVAGTALLTDDARSMERPPSDGVLELRQYTVYGGQREVLISLFEREFVASQAEVGAYVRGTFRDLDDPDRFVWMRGFADMASRRRALESFYGGPVWARHRTAANGTMLDAANVLMLRPAELDSAAVPAGPANSPPGAIYSATIHAMAGTPLPAFREFYRTAIRPRLVAGGAVPVIELETEPASNDYPRLPVRAETVFVWWARWPRERELQAFQRHWASLSGWRDAAPEAVLPALMRKPEVLRLAPTATSALR